jgi:murein peptide amidase A
MTINLRKLSAPLAGLCLILMISGCSREPTKEIIGKSVEGRPIEAITLGNGPERIWILATIHGNEWAGTPLVQKLMSYLKRRPDFLEGKTLVISPVVNPDGFDRNQRRNVNGIDLNRNFPAKNRQNTERFGMTELSEPESKAMYDFLHRFKPDRIVTIHQPFSIVDWDGPGLSLAEHMARHTVLPFARVGSQPGSLGAHAGEDLRIPIITYELPPDTQKDTPSIIWGRYGRALLSAIVFPNDVSKWNFYMPLRPMIFFPAILLFATALIAAFTLMRKRTNSLSNPIPAPESPPSEPQP